MVASSARLIRVLVATIAALAALAGAAGSADATTCGIKSKLCLDMTRSPATGFITRDGVATYTVTVSSSGTPTATKVTLSLALPQGAEVLRSVTAKPCTPPQGATTLVTCDLGSVKPSATPLVFTFDVQMHTAVNDANVTATLSADARNSDKGSPDPTQETFSVADVIDINATDGQAVSAVPKGLRGLSLDTDANGSGATGLDQRTALFKIFANDFATTAVIDDQVADQGFVCPQGLKCPSGGWTQAIIPGPLPTGGIGPCGPFLPPNEIHIELVYDASTIPSGLNENNYVLLHDRDCNAATTDYQQIDQRCSRHPQPPCLENVVPLADGDLRVDAFVDGNFRYR